MSEWVTHQKSECESTDRLVEWPIKTRSISQMNKNCIVQELHFGQEHTLLWHVAFGMARTTQSLAEGKNFLKLLEQQITAKLIRVMSIGFHAETRATRIVASKAPSHLPCPPLCRCLRFFHTEDHGLVWWSSVRPRNSLSN